jgi:ElaB/YqjD/DUF883 family membrane-anchored ribosome-binding protein
MNFGKTRVEKVEDTAVAYGKQVANGIDSVVDTANDMAQDALSNVATRLDSVHDQAKPAVDRMVARGQELVHDAITGTREAGARAKKAVSGYASACESYVTEQPMKAVAIAAAAGATIAALLMLARSRSNQRTRYIER